MSERRTALVTGSSRGIGRAIALALGSEDFNVVVNYHANKNAADEVAGQIDHAHVVPADVADAADRQRLVDETIAAFGPIHLLVNNAGIAPRVRADLLEADEDEFDRVLAANLKGPYFLSQLVANHMIGAGVRGQMVNIGSLSAYTASVNRGEYCVAKAGVAMMTKLFAARLAEHDINVYEIRPGIIATDMTGPVKEKYDKLIHETDLQPIKRWGRPEDIASTVMAIANGLLPYSTGEVINVDGGFHLRRL